MYCAKPHFFSRQVEIVFDGMAGLVVVEKIALLAFITKFATRSPTIRSDPVLAVLGTLVAVISNNATTVTTNAVESD